MSATPKPVAVAGGIDVSTVADTKSAQADVCRRLRERGRAFPAASLRGCTFKECGRKRCVEACRFGSIRWIQAYAPKISDLLHRTDAVQWAVRVSRRSWCKPVGQLSRVSIGTAEKLARRALDKLRNPQIVAVGSYKVFVLKDASGTVWRPEVHLLVAGAEGDDLRQAFEGRGYDGDYVTVDRVVDLSGAVSAVLDYKLLLWQHPAGTSKALRPNKSKRAEYYVWALGIPSGGLTVRYGCDRHFNPLLDKRGPTLKPKASKPRRSPVWLERYQFGSEYWENRNVWKIYERG